MLLNPRRGDSPAWPDIPGTSTTPGSLSYNSVPFFTSTCVAPPSLTSGAPDLSEHQCAQGNPSDVAEENFGRRSQ